MNRNMRQTGIFWGLPWLLLLASLFPSGCSSEPPALTIGDVGFTEAELLGFNGNRRTRLAELTAFGLSVARGEALEVGHPLIQRRTRESLLQSLEREVSLRLSGLDQEALAARYEDDPEYELSVRHLVLLVEPWEAEEAEEAARDKAEAALARIRGGEDFGAVAGEVSEEPGAAERGGLLEPGRRGSWVEDFWRAASALEVGEVSPVIRSEYGYHVLKLEGRTPVPFSQARHYFVERTSELVSPDPEAVRAWMDSASADLSVDSAALATDYEAAGSLFLLANEILLLEGPDRVLARWDGGEYTAGELRDYLLSQDRPSWDGLRQGGLGDFLLAATNAARRSLLAQTAGGMGISLPPAVEERHRRDWAVACQTWAQALGFSQGMGREAVKEVALAAVGSTNQGVSLARTDVRNWAPMLLSYYPIGPETE